LKKHDKDGDLRASPASTPEAVCKPGQFPHNRRLEACTLQVGVFLSVQFLVEAHLDLNVEQLLLDAVVSRGQSADLAETGKGFLVALF
jgi:hypothetical protein